MGVVWRAHDELLDRVVAVKEVRYRGIDETERADLNRRTVREARTAGRLDHPSVIIVHDVVEEGGRPWIVMQLVRSRSLGQAVRERGPLPPEQVAAVGLSVLGALRAAHAAGVLHRDVKPENVLLADDGRVVLTDFGIAATTHETGITRTGGMVGTPAFLPPERLHGLPATPESDLWSLGATLYAALEGHPPFERPTAAATMMAVLSGEPSPMRHTGPLATAVLGLMSKDPATRMRPDQAEDLLIRAAGGTPPGLVAPSRELSRPSPPVAPAYGTPPGHPPAAPAPYGAPPGQSSPSAQVPAYDRQRPRPIPPERPAAHPGAPAWQEQPAPPVEPARHEWNVHPGTAAGHGQHGSPAARHGQHGSTAAHPWPLPAQDQQTHPGDPAYSGGGTGPTHPTHAEGRAPASGGRGWRVALMAGVPLLAVLLGAGGWLLFQNQEKGRAEQGITASATPETGTSTAGPAPTPTPTPSAPPDREIPAGWKLHEDPLGFSVAVPRGWTVRRFAGRDRVEFREPGSDRFLWIESTDDPEKDPVRHWEKVEEGGRAKNVWPGYERVAITSLTYLDRPAADWEFTFLRDEVPTHVLDRGFRTGEGTPYAIYWETPEDSWDRTFFDRFTETFRP
ncbi:serine/threonine protein kinase [Planobispora longispora]|uniref:non-specific serine/threonine protein kinase n=2 Tax=Planobispora longispora TaxID=28887 RepID=A0A8J3RHW2_9ACTN|nr:serine/threonine protein kinase [Planobispora longispora]